MVLLSFEGPVFCSTVLNLLPFILDRQLIVAAMRRSDTTLRPGLYMIILRFGLSDDEAPCPGYYLNSSPHEIRKDA